MLNPPPTPPASLVPVRARARDEVRVAEHQRKVLEDPEQQAYVVGGQKRARGSRHPHTTSPPFTRPARLTGQQPLQLATEPGPFDVELLLASDETGRSGSRRDLSCGRAKRKRPAPLLFKTMVSTGPCISPWHLGTEKSACEPGKTSVGVLRLQRRHSPQSG